MKTKQIRHCEELDKDGRDMALWTAVPTVFFTGFTIKKGYFCFGTIMAMSKHTEFLFLCLQLSIG